MAPTTLNERGVQVSMSTKQNKNVVAETTEEKLLIIAALNLEVNVCPDCLAKLEALKKKQVKDWAERQKLKGPDKP